MSMKNPDNKERVSQFESRKRLILLRLRELFHVKQSERELEEEMRFDLERRIEAKLETGMTRKEAEMAVKREFGSVDLAKEECRDERGTRWLEDLWQDIGFGLRMLRKNPGFTAVAVLTLALGIGANSAIFSVVSAVLLRPLPYPNGSQLLHIQEKHAGGAGAHFTYASYLDLERNSKTIENVAAYRPWTFNLTSEVEPEQVFGAQVSAHFFLALGRHALLGRLIGRADDQNGGDNRVAVLSYALWQGHFGGDREIIGKTTEINSERYAVIGVMPPNFAFPDFAKIWCPLVAEGELRENRRSHLLTAIGDLRRGEPLPAVQSEMQAIAAQIENQNPGVDPGMTIKVVPLKDSIVAPVRPVLVTLFIAVGLLLLIACANVANLLIARGAARGKEIATRLALGAGRVRLARQLLTESALVALLGGVVGICIAWWALRFIQALNGDFPRFGEIHLDWRVLEFTMLLSFVAAALFGLAPALASLKLDLNASLKERVPSSQGAPRRGINQPLVALQFALAMVLLVGAGLLGHSFLRLLNVSPGFNTENLLTMQVFLPPVEFPELDPKGAVVIHQILEQVRALPGVQSAGMVSTLPITGGPDTDFVIQGRPAPRPNDEPSADIRIIDPEYFRVMGIPLRAGREFAEADNYQSARVMIVNQTMAREFWPNESPLGQRVTMMDWGPPLTGEVVGIVGDTKADGLDEEMRSMIYWPYTQFPQNFNAFVIRSAGDPMALVPLVKERVWSVEKNLPISEIATMEQVLSDSLSRRRLYTVLLGIFAGSALLLAAVGVYGVVSQSVSQRMHEMGLRVALGAQRKDVLVLVLGRGLTVALIGMAFGMAAAMALTRLISALLFGVSATDPWAYGAVAVVLAMVALFACYVPARRAMNVDPVVALRCQ